MSLASPTIRQTVVMALTVSGLAVAALAGTALWSNRSLSAVSLEKSAMAQVLHRHMEADMMHDALRADLLAAMADSKTDARREEIRADLAEHRDRFTQNIEENRAAELPGPVAAALDAVGPRLDAYQRLAATLVDAELALPGAAAARLPEFRTAFGDLEDAMADTSDRILAEVDRVEAEARVIESDVTLFVTLAILLAALSLAGTYLVIARRVSAPILAITACMGRLAGRDLGVAIVGVGRKDEIGRMADAVQVFKDSMIEADRLQSEQQAEHARKEERQQRIEADIQSFDVQVQQALATLTGASTELRATAESMAAIAEETSRQSTAVASVSEQASANVQTVAAANEEMASSIAEIAARRASPVPWPARPWRRLPAPTRRCANSPMPPSASVRWSS